MALHQMARGYPRESPTDQQKTALVSYVTSLGDLLPCSFCAKHWRELAPSVAQATGSRHDVLKWTIDVHNAVNARLHKPVLTYAQAVEDMEARCPGNAFSGLYGQQGVKALQAMQQAQESAAAYQVCTGVLAAVALLLLIAVIVVSVMKRSSRR
jgi:hypothetical protein